MKKTVIIPAIMIALAGIPTIAGVKASAMWNPWKETTVNEIRSDYGYKFSVPDNAEDIECYIMNENGLAEIDFTLSGLDYTLRIENADDFEDISGLYYEWDSVALADVCGIKVTENANDDICSALWFDDEEDTMYSVSVKGESVGIESAEMIITEMYE